MKLRTLLEAGVALVPLIALQAFWQEDASTKPYEPVTDQFLANFPAGDWLQYRRT